jgi:hypothetical protein
MSARQSKPAAPRKSYTAVGSFGYSFFTYNYGMNSQTLVEEGVLTVVGPQADCPAGRILYENGKKIVPTSAPFPPIKVVGTIEGQSNNSNLTSYMVGVFDPQSGLSGFIDPNSVNFAINSTDLPVFLNNDIGRGPFTNIKNSGNPVVTNGNILSLAIPTLNNLDLTNGGEMPLPNYVGVASRGADYLNLGGINSGPGLGIFAEPYALAINNGFDSNSFGLVTGQGGDPDSTNWSGMYASGDVYFTGNLYTRRTAGTATLVYGGTVGSAATVTVPNVSIGSAGAIVFLTHKGNAGNRGVLSYELIASGGVGPANDLVITSSNTDDRSQVNWFIVNVGVDGGFGEVV